MAGTWRCYHTMPLSSAPVGGIALVSHDKLCADNIFARFNGILNSFHIEFGYEPRISFD
jgi:hypothetical protein